MKVDDNTAQDGHLVPTSFRWHSSGRAGFDVREDHVGTLTVGSGLGIPSPPAVLVPSTSDADKPIAFHLTQDPIHEVDATMALSRGAMEGAASIGVAVPFVKAKRASSDTDDETCVADAPAPTLNAMDNGGESRATVLAVSENQRGEVRLTDYAQQITTGGGKPGQGYPAVAIPIQDGRGLDKQQNGLGVGEPGDPGYTIDTTGAQAIATPSGQEGDTLAVRRLTPVECERLMGWPDDWTRWADDGEEIADSHRYRMCGNGVVSNVTEWIGRRLIGWAT